MKIKLLIKLKSYEWKHVHFNVKRQRTTSLIKHVMKKIGYYNQGRCLPIDCRIICKKAYILVSKQHPTYHKCPIPIMTKKIGTKKLMT